jgi:hypothetical protein
VGEQKQNGASKRRYIEKSNINNNSRNASNGKDASKSRDNYNSIYATSHRKASTEEYSKVPTPMLIRFGYVLSVFPLSGSHKSQLSPFVSGFYNLLNPH